MSRRREKDRLPPFVAVTWKVLNSKAYKALRPSSGKALPYFIGKGRNKTHKYREYFPFSYSEARRLGFSESTFFNVIRDIMRKGFIDPIDKGGLRGCRKTNSKFALSDRWEQFGEPDFKEIKWEQFQPQTEL